MPDKIPKLIHPWVGKTVIATHARVPNATQHAVKVSDVGSASIVGPYVTLHWLCDPILIPMGDFHEDDYDFQVIQ